MSNTWKHEEKISGKPKSTLHIICSLVKKKKPYATQASAESDQSLSESSDTSLTPDSFDHFTDSREETLQFPIRQISVRSDCLTTLGTKELVLEAFIDDRASGFHRVATGEEHGIFTQNIDRADAHQPCDTPLGPHQSTP